jgi:hypothetical protein
MPLYWSSTFPAVFQLFCAIQPWQEGPLCSAPQPGLPLVSHPAKLTCHRFFLSTYSSTTASSCAASCGCGQAKQQCPK